MTSRSDRSDRSDQDPTIMQVSLPDINTMVTPMSSLEVTKTSLGYNYSLKMYFATPEEIIDEQTLETIKQFDAAFRLRFPIAERPAKPERPEKPAKPEKPEKGGVA